MDTEIKKQKNPAPIIIFSLVGLFSVICIGVTIFYFVSLKPRIEVSRHISMGNKFVNEMDYEKAILAYENALEIDPKNVSAYLFLANAYELNGDDVMALATAQRGYDETGNAQLGQLVDTLIAKAEKNKALQEQDEDRQSGDEEEKPDPEDIDSGLIEFEAINPGGEYHVGETQGNPGSHGMVSVTFDFESDIPVEFRIAEWKEINPEIINSGDVTDEKLEPEKYTEAEIAEIADLFEGIWTDQPNNLMYGGRVSSSYPVYDEDNGKVFWVLLLARDSSGKIVGYTQVMSGTAW